jgi:hypothetical protein
MSYLFLRSVFRIHIGFNADPSFYFSAGSDPGSQANAVPDPGQTLPSQKVGFCHEK